jgi:hypothetical protein
MSLHRSFNVRRSSDAYSRSACHFSRVLIWDFRTEQALEYWNRRTLLSRTEECVVCMISSHNV